MIQPLLTLGYTLNPTDAVAYEALPREMRGWRKWALLIWLGAVGGLVAFLPPELIGPEWGWRFWLAALVLVALAYGAATLVMTIAMHRRARRRVPAPLEMKLEQWGDHLAVERGGQKSFAAYETIAAVSIGHAHVFIDVPPEVIIVPKHAFADEGEMAAFGQDMDRLSGLSTP